MDVERAHVVAVVRLRRFLVSAAHRAGVASDPAVAAGLLALEELDRAVRAADYVKSVSPTLPQRPGHGWVTVMEAARRLGLTPRAVRYRIGAGTLRGARDRRGRWFVDPSTLEN